MAELKSRRSVGGRVGDTNNGFTITKVFSDGVYLWDAQLEEKIGDIENELAEQVGQMQAIVQQPTIQPENFDGKVNGMNLSFFYRLARDN